ncbi:3-keto-5-aminohexanoate cleavage protein [Streptomyces sp. NPDC048603]|uniref:3-keto-5-aminohexanoate cleavage protein n=1 Tax=Streptomyces sp. NPDC048603 TaxID=3365577 RepID=UPI0037224215
MTAARRGRPATGVVAATAARERVAAVRGAEPHAPEPPGAAVLQVALNGSRTAAEGAAVPMSPEALVEAAVASVAAGATEVLVHPRTPCGRESLSPRVVGPVLAALRAAVRVPLAVCATVATEPDPAARLARIAGWEVLPDRAVVDLSEPGAVDLAMALAGRGVAVDGVVRPLPVCLSPATEDVPGRPGDLPHRPDGLPHPLEGLPLTRLLVPLPGGGALGRLSLRMPCHGPEVPLARLLEACAGEVVLYGRDGAAWPVLRSAARLGAGRRTGIGDVLHLPDGRPAPSNAALVTAALASGREGGSAARGGSR